MTKPEEDLMQYLWEEMEKKKKPGKIPPWEKIVDFTKSKKTSSGRSRKSSPGSHPRSSRRRGQASK